MSGKPEGHTGPPGLQNVVVYVSSEGFYTNNGSSGSTYSTAPAVRPQYQQQSKLPSFQQQHPFYNVQQQQNEFQYNVSNYNGNGSRIRTNNLQQEDSYSLMGGDRISGNVFARCSEAESSCSSLSSVSDHLESASVNSVRTYKGVGSVLDTCASIAVPAGWKRLHTNGMVIYVSPSNTALNSIEQLKDYLQTQGTCKCGLECPLNCDIVFNFDPKVLTRPWSGGSVPVGDLTKLCNHKRKQLAANLEHQLDMKRDGTKKKKRKVAVSHGTASVSQLLAQREKDRSKEVQLPQNWPEGSHQVRRDDSPMLHMQSQIPQLNRSVYPAVYNNKNESPSTRHFFRHNIHNGCMPQEQQAEAMNGDTDNSYLSSDTTYPMQQNCSGHLNSSMMINHQYQYHPRACQGPERQNIDHHCHQKLQNPPPQIMMQQQHYQHQQFHQTHLPQTMIQRPQMSHTMELNQMMTDQQGHTLQQHYDRMIVPTTQFQYSDQEHKTVQLMAAQHQLCVNKSQIPKREVYQRTEVPQVHQIHQGMVLQTSQGQVMLPQQAMVLHHQHNPPMQLSQNQSTIVHRSEILEHSPNPLVHQSYQQTNQQGMLQQSSSHGHSNTQVLLPNQQDVMLQNHQQNINQTQSNSNSNNNNNDKNNLCPSSTVVMHQQRPTPPWHTNQNNHVMNQNIPINQQHQQNTAQLPQHSQQNVQPNVYDRVPPLHHNLPSASMWSDDRKKNAIKVQGKPAVNMKNKRLYPGDQLHHCIRTSNVQSCPNIDVRQLPQSSQSQPFSNTNNIPSFMEDPSGYLAQQTALLNSTISRQTGINNKGVNIICQTTCNPQTNNQNTSQASVVLGLSASSSSPTGSIAVPIYSNSIVPKQHFITRVSTNQVNNSSKTFSSNSVSSTAYQNQIHAQVGVPDSSRVSPDAVRCSQDCVSSVTSITSHFDNQNQTHSVQNPVSVKFQPDDNPVTSSTFMENHQQVQSVSKYDNRGPIQGGTISTSNRSPSEALSRIPIDESSPVRSPTPASTPSGRLDSSPESSIFISSASPFTINNSNTIIYQQQEPANTSMSRSEGSTSIQHSPKAQQINIVLQDVQMSRIPTIVTTMASGHTVSSNTITSVLAGRANTATVSVNNQTSVAPPTVPPSILTSQQIPLVSISKSPLEMVQSVVSSIQVPVSSAESVLKPATAPSLPAGHILMSSNGQLLVTNTQGQSTLLSPQQNLAKINTAMPAMSAASSIVTSVTGAVSQVIPAVGVTQQVLGQPTVLVNTLPTPLLFQPSVMTMDGTMNTVQIPHLAVATGNVLPGQMVDESRVSNNANGAFSPRNQPPLLSPDGVNGKRKSNAKKRKVSPTVASMLHIAAQQNSPPAGATGMVVQQQQSQQNFSPPMLQALTILPSKTGHFGGTQQLIATGNILQPLNLVQNFPTIQQFLVPAGLGGMVMATGDGTATLLQDTVQLNVLTPMQGPGGTVFGHTGGQSILAASPAGMVIRTPTNSNQQATKVQLHSQSSSGNQFLANSPNQFLMNNSTFNSQLSPMLTNVSPTNQQIHPFNNGSTNGQARGNQEFIQCGQTLMVPCTIAQSPASQNTTVVQQNTTIVQQQTTMVSSNQQPNIDQSPGPSNSASSSISLNQHNFILNNNDGKQQNFILTTDQKGPGQFILSPNPDKPGTHIILNTDKAQYGGLIISQDKPNQVCGNFILSNANTQHTDKASNNFIISSGINPEKQPLSRFSKHSVSTQTAANQQVLQISSTPLPTALVVATSNTFCQTSTTSSYSGSPPDTTTHSPVDGGISQSPGFNSEATSSSVAVGSTDDLPSPTSSSDPAGRSQPMVHCVSSSNEQDSPDWKETAASPGMFSPPPASDLIFIRGSGSTKNVSIASIVESSSSPLQSFEDEKILKHNEKP